MIIFDGSCQLVKELDIYIELDLHIVKSRYLLFQDCLLGVNASDYRCNGTSREGKRDDTEEH